MWEAWSKLCKKNVDHYNEHPGAHNAAALALTGVAVVGIIMIARKVQDKTINRRFRKL